MTKKAQLRPPKRRAEKKGVVANVRWGVTNAIVVTLACFVPAVIVALAAPAGVRADQLRFVLAILGYYLAFAVVAGAIVGGFRRGVQRPGGATSVGALVGAIGLSALMYVPIPEARQVEGRELTIAAVLGAVVGAGLGRHFWRSARRAGRHA